MVHKRDQRRLVAAVLLTAASLIISLAIASNPLNSESRIFALKSRPIVRQGDALPIEIDVDLDRSKPIDCIELFRVHELRIDDKNLSIRPDPEIPAENANYEGSVMLSAEHGGFASPWPLPISGDTTRNLSPGQHTIHATLVFDRFDANALTPMKQVTI